MRLIRFSKEQLPDFQKTVVTIGSFDGVHAGHQELIKRAVQEAKNLASPCIAISFEPHPRIFLDPSEGNIGLLTTQEEKISLLEELGVDYFVIVPFTHEFSQLQPGDYIESFLLKNFNPAIVVIGHDHRYGIYGSGDAHLLREYEQVGAFQLIQVHARSFQGNLISSSAIRNSIKKNEWDKVRQFLLRNYRFSGKVISGDHIGTSLGYPTANVEVSDKLKLLPSTGVYAAKGKVNDRSYSGMLYIGNRPSIADGLGQNIEIHFFDFNDEIYGRNITIEIIDFIRADIKFDSLEELRSQIQADEYFIRKSIFKYSILDAATLSKPKIAVAVLNFNGIEYLKKYLSPLVEHSSHLADIYVIDNASSDDSVGFVRSQFPMVKIINLKKNYGFAEGYNKGLAQIKADYFALLNSDVLVNDDWLTPLVKTIQSDPFILAVQPKILSLLEPVMFEYAGAAGGLIDALGYPFCKGRIMQTIEKDEQQYDGISEVFWGSGAALLVNAKAFHQLGGFDSEYFAHQEEIDLCWRMKRAGGKVMVNTASRVFHLGGGTLDYEKPYKLYLNFRNNITTIFKNIPWYKLIYILPIRTVLDIVIALKYILTGKVLHGWYIIEAYIFSIISTPFLIHKKEKTYALIQRNKLGYWNNVGLLRSSIIAQYFLFGNKTVRKINPTNFVR